ncbi:MAG TPA: hypothetical protein VN456_01950 [Desulfosporosinus sp.]|nr:hypothetical protein [Desulfosporosinus sp.]
MCHFKYCINASSKENLAGAHEDTVFARISHSVSRRCRRSLLAITALCHPWQRSNLERPVRVLATGTLGHPWPAAA